eukprot:COSAG01_NODE_412_length_17370_cov_26.910196_6_plen_245_part_00
MIQIKSLHKSFEGKQVIRSLSLDVASGSRVAIIGPSGCGKSTLLKLITGLLPFDAGEIIINQQALGPNLDTRLEVPYLKDIGMLFQTAALFDSLSVYENVAFYIRECLQEKDETKIRSFVAEKLALVDMSGYEASYPASLSGGQRKRIGLARALMKEPRIMLYDEPTTGLDPILSNNIEDLIVSLSDKLQVTSLIITHQHSTIFRTAQKIYFMDEGELIGPESVASIQHSQYAKIREFFNAEVE